MILKKSAIALLFSPTLAFSVTSTWTGAVDTNWGTTTGLTNWDAGIPGQSSAATDSATFGSTVGAGANISLTGGTAISPGLSSLTFNNATTPYTIVSAAGANFIQFNGTSSALHIASGSHVLGSDTSTSNANMRTNNTTLTITADGSSSFTINGAIREAAGSTASNIIFEGPGTLTNQPSTGNNGIIIAGIFTQSSGAVVNNNITDTSTATRSLIAPQLGFVINGGTYTSTNSGNISVASLISGSRNAPNNSGGPATFTINNGATVSGNNTGAISGTGNIGNFFKCDGGFIVNGGSTFSLTNGNSGGSVGAVSGTAFGNDIFSNGSMTINNGTVSLTNLGPITVSGTGNLLSAAGGIIINAGSTLSAVNGNSGGAVGTVSGSGTALGNNIVSTGDITVNNGTLSLTNFSSVSTAGSRGSQSQCANFLLNGGTISVTNNGPVTSGRGCGFVSTSATTFDTGTITATNTGTITSGNGIIFSATSIQINEGVTATFTNSGPAITGTATFINSTGSGGTTINGGNITLSNSGNMGGSGACRGAQLQVNSPGVFTLNGGTLSLNNTGIINSSVAAFGTRIIGVASGVINGGTLTLTNTGTVSGTSSGGSQVATTTSLVMNGGTVTLSANTGDISGTTTAGNRLLVGTTFTLNGGSVTLAANAGNVSGTNTAGSILTVTNGFTINGGSLINNDTVKAPSLTIGTAGNVSGRGVFDDTSSTATIAVTNSGTLTPGDAGVNASNPGVMTINGGYTQTSSGTLVANLLNSTTYSQLHITGTTTGTAQLDGSLRVGVSPGASVAPGDLYNVVLTDLGVTGTFSQVTTSNPYLVPHLTYFPTYVQLSLTSTMINYVNCLGALIPLINETNVRLGREMEHLANRLDSRQEFPNRELFAQGNTFSTALLASNEEFYPESSACEPERPWNVYFGPLGNFGKADTQGAQVGCNYASGGALAGVNYTFSQVGVGVELEYDHIAGRLNDQWGKFKVNEAHASAYASYVPKQLPHLAVNGIIGGSYEWYNIHRDIPLSATPAVGKPKGSEFDAFAGLEYTFSTCQFRAIPLASLQYITLNTESYHERGAGGFDLKVAHQKARSLRSTLGTRLNYGWKKRLAFNAEVDLAWQREYLSQERSVQFTPVAVAQPFTALVLPGSTPNIFLGGLNLSALHKERYKWGVSYDIEWNKRYVNNSVYVGFDVRF